MRILFSGIALDKGLSNVNLQLFLLVLSDWLVRAWYQASFIRAQSEDEYQHELRNFTANS